MPQHRLKEIRAKIKNTAFKVKDVPVPDPKNPDKQKILSVCTKFRSIGKNEAITLESFVFQDNISGHYSKLEDFISELAEWILGYEEEEKNIIKYIKEDYLIDTEKALTDIGCYQKGTIKKALSILRKDLNTMRLRNNFFSTKTNEIKKDKEDIYLYEIRSVYRRYFQQDLTPNQMTSNMAILLSAFDFLPDKKKEKIFDTKKAIRYYGKMKKRFEVLDELYSGTKTINHTLSITEKPPK